MNVKNLTWEEAVLWLKSQPEQEKLVYSCFYDDPLIKAANRYYNSTEWAAVRSLLPQSCGKALDLGAGRGIASYALAQDNWETTALEPDSSDIVGAGAIRMLAKESGLSIRVIEEWGEELPFSDETFDLIYGRQVLHHARDLQQLCKEISRVLKKDGFFIATREHVITKSEDLKQFFEKHPLHKLYGGENAYLLKEYVDAIKQSGISITLILNPFESNINLYPQTIRELKIKLSKRIKFPYPNAIPSFLLRLFGFLSNTPGRLYTFIGRK